MSSPTVSGAAGRLVVEPGDRVRAEGRFVRIDDADWLDLAQVDGLVLWSAPRKSDRSVRLVGAEAPVPPHRLHVLGVWHGDVIEVEAQGPVEYPEGSEPRPELPAPPGGWDTVDQSQQVRGLDELRRSGAIVRDAWIYAEGAVLLRVAADDVEAVERALAPQLPRRLFVVQSRYTAAQLGEVADMFKAHARQWGFEEWGYEGLDASSQPYAFAALTRVSADLASWADTLPEGLLTLHPAMRPAT